VPTVFNEVCIPSNIFGIMNRDYIDWLTSLPNNRGVRSRQVNVWMAGYAPLPDEIDLQHCEEMQQRWVVRDCPDSVLGRLWRWVSR
jgi:hypothetical protein